MRVSLRHVLFGLLSLPSTTADADFDSVKTHLTTSHADIDPKKPNKYFHEATFHRHYDGRFGAAELPYDERRDRLSYLIQSYLRTMNDLGIETFLMHGSLLGWWWNSKIMPWDNDVDVMVSERSIRHLAAFYNMTVHRHHLPNLWAPRQYLLEINPHYLNDSVDIDNGIDARWIDTDVGLYIDITTLRRNRTAQETLGIDGAMMAKDGHSYAYDDVFPLRETTFEGMPARIPYAYAELLMEEYGEEALSHVEFEDHEYDLAREEWIPNANARAKEKGREMVREMERQKGA
jgi:hypothetical protein